MVAWEGLVGSLVSAGAKLIPGLVGDGSDKQEAQWNANFELQQRMAEHGTLIRARDVMRAYSETGIHPLSLMGMNPANASPVASVGGSSSNWRKGVADAGQDIGRAISATAGHREREELRAITVQRGNLENELLRVQIANQVQALERNANIGPPLPSDGSKALIPGQGETVNHPGVESKVLPDVSVARTPRGGYVVIPGKEAKERMEEMFGLGPEWFTRNRLWLATPEARQWVQKYLPPPPANMEYTYHAPTGEWLPGYKKYEDRHMFRDKSYPQPWYHFKSEGRIR